MDGFAVWLYADARELLDEPNLPTYGCLLIDYYLPDLDGLELLAKLRSRGVALPAILVTGHPSLGLLSMDLQPKRIRARFAHR